ncbi:hypothetical protein B0T22DRAFT_463606 [Podospora appendiculata]|uniref:Fungal N-terminal domain-containing protein n=1 Tax=Podospora appendiculata TaxID=314037 RepID=A0AAE0XD63_9PEZI|nr:hypothetical protein B0T22DRAFT_463606 [Podospora appendiculata]
MNPLSITAGVNIPDALDAVTTLTNDLRSVDLALASVQAVTELQWKSLGEAVTAQSKAAITSCKTSCKRFNTSLDRWTRHSTDGTLSWRDRTSLGVFKQGHIKSMSEQLQNCNVTLTSIASIATLHSSLQQTQTAEEINTMISTKETAVNNAIAATNDHAYPSGARRGRNGSDQTSATKQVAMEKKALGESRKVLEGLFSGPTVTFGSHNQGQQVGVNSGTIHATFGGKGKDL